MAVSAFLGASSAIKPGVVTTATRPSAPFVGQMIYDTTVSQALVWNGSAWVNVGAPRIGQVVTFTYNTQVATTSTSYVTTNLTATITPTLSTSKVMIIAQTAIAENGTGTTPILTIFRGTVAGTNLASDASWGWGRTYSSAGLLNTPFPLSYLDSPATTSATTYTIGFKVGANTGYAQANGGMGVITLMEVLV